jgi:hypothetical protein
MTAMIEAAAVKRS